MAWMRTASSTHHIWRVLLQTACLGLFATGAWSTVASPKPAKAPKKTIDYNRDVRPIITKCFTCHGHDPKTVAAGLRLDDGPSAKTKLRDGKIAIVPGHPEQSELIARIYAKDDMDLMPPKDSNKVLSAEEKAVLKKWIEEGAEYKEHWAFVAPVRPALPTVKLKSWPKNAIDYFTLEKMEERGLKPSPQADRRTLIRRVTLDLTGLPPTPHEVNAFLNDKSPNAYDKVVDRLLASPRYGERMAMDWMDYARYADSNGYQADFERFQWRWRDWVIDAFNKNMPYDRFTVDQIAGDMLPNATMDERLATGFNRNHRINTEGGVVLEEWRVENVIDRVETTSQTWLGLTAGCARCHDHKYDPLTQKDFYSLFAYFNNVSETGSGEERPVNHPPVMKAPTKDQQSELAVLDAQVAKGQREIDGIVAANAGNVTDWKPSNPSLDAALERGLAGRYTLANPLQTTGQVPAPKVDGEVSFGTGRSTGAATITDKGFIDLGQAGDFDTHDAFSYGLWIKPERGGASPISRMDSGDQYRGWDIFLNGDRPAMHIISQWPENAMKVVSKVPIPMGKWSHVFVTYDGSAQPSGVHIYVDGRAVATEVEGTPNLTGSIRTKVSAKIGTRTGTDRFHGEVDDARIYSRELQSSEVAKLADVPDAASILAIPVDKRTPEQKRELVKLWLRERDASFRQRLARQQSLLDSRTQVDNEISTVMVMDDKKPRQAYVLVRGQYDKHGDPVQARLPAFLEIKGKSFANNRLGLAKWMVDPQNPLTSRVTVNRLWDRFFGTGIVPTVEDFGTRADFPSHPELLDWLAREFVDKGWNLKGIVHEIVTSATYRQTSVITPDRMKADPTNKWLARGPRFRLPGEVLRDQAMYVGGMLTEKVGGPSVRPYQPDGVWDEVNVYGNLRNYKHDTDANLHRRSLYTIWKRTAAPPIMTLFDVPSRETCRVRRARTDTPLQALAMLNDVTYVEAARSLALRMLREGGKSAESRLDFAFQTTLSRDPQPEEKKILLAGLQKRLARYRANRKLADGVLQQGDLLNDPFLDNAEVAAYTVLASTILNMDEAVTRE